MRGCLMNGIPNNIPVKIGQIWAWTNWYNEKKYAKVLDIRHNTDSIFIVRYITFDLPTQENCRWPQMSCSLETFLGSISDRKR
jgi:hypothetical protein